MRGYTSQAIVLEATVHTEVGQPPSRCRLSSSSRRSSSLLCEELSHPDGRLATHILHRLEVLCPLLASEHSAYGRGSSCSKLPQQRTLSCNQSYTATRQQTRLSMLAAPLPRSKIRDSLADPSLGHPPDAWSQSPGLKRLVTRSTSSTASRRFRSRTAGGTSMILGSGSPLAMSDVYQSRRARPVVIGVLT